MKKQTLWLLVIGNLCMTFGLFASPLITVSDPVNDFLKGFGFVFIVSSLFMQRKTKRTS